MIQSIHASARAASGMSPVVFVGGIGQRAAAWSKWSDDLVARGVPHIIADVPFAGFSKRSSYIDAIDGARSALLAEHGLPATTRVSIVGFSAGGGAAVAYLRVVPERVDRVVAVSSPLRGNELATVGSKLLGGLMPRWVRDLSSDVAALRGIDASLGSRITSITGRSFDGIVSARSGAHESINVVRSAELGQSALHHGAVQTSLPGVRAAAWDALT
jgi:pimeloyl-ACP methyl ester carboxylesterase